MEWNEDGDHDTRSALKLRVRLPMSAKNPYRKLRTAAMQSIRPFVGILALTLLQQNAPAQRADVTRVTLDNGLRVVVIRDALAPVATLEENYLVGANEVPADLPGLAHAQEHMAFRGCTGLTADQIAAIYAQLGGLMDAQTQQNTTQYFVTVPAQDLDLAMRIDSACMADVEDAQEQWAQERGAIEQEVASDLSNPTYKFLTRLNHDLFAGTPYEQDALGTQASFDKTTGALLKDFYNRWYAPNNAILVITGDVDPVNVIAKVKEYYGKIPRRPIAARPQVNLKPVEADSFELPSNLPYLLTLVAYRFPGTDSPDFAAARVLTDVMASQRAALYDLVPQGKALGTDFDLAESYPKASAAFALAALPAGTDPAATTAELMRILQSYANGGVPPDLVEAAKKGEVANAEFGRNSISNLASLWSQALAAEGKQSPDEIVDAIKQVTVDDVNRVAKKYLLDKPVVGTLKPSPSGEAVSSKGFGGSEKATSTPTKPVALPNWAENSVKSLRVPEPSPQPVDIELKNGIRLIVRTERTSSTVTVMGSIKTQTQLQTPAGQDGVADILEGLFSYGTKKLDRVAFQKALDDIAAGESAGMSFSLKVLSSDFVRGVELLADNELHPALPEDAFKIVQQQTAELTAGELESPTYRMDRALLHALVPAGDPLLRETTPKTVNSIHYADVLKFYQSTFRPDLTTIVVMGDITPEAARATIDKYFGAWSSDGPKPSVVLPAIPANKPQAVDVPDASRVQDEVNLSQELEMNRFSPEYYPLQLGNHVLGGGFYATRLYRALRQRAGLVYTIEDSLDAGETRTVYSVTYGCDPKNVSKARAMIEQELTDMQKNNVTPAELQQAKALLLRQIPLAEASEDAVATALIARARIGLPLDEPKHAADTYFKLTADEIRNAFAKYLSPANFVQVVRGPAPQ
jgi:zinc protease